MKYGITASSLLLLSGCALTTSSPEMPAAHQSQSPQQATIAHSSVEQIHSNRITASEPLTLKQIMADPDWLGVLAEKPYFADDGRSIYYQRQRYQAVTPQFYQLTLDSPLAQSNPLALGSQQKQSRQLSLSELHQASQNNGQLNPSRSHKVYLYQGNVFIKDLNSQHSQQLTQSATPITHVQFLTDGRIAYFTNNQVYAINPRQGLTELLAQLKTEEAPKKVTTPSSFLARQQHRLIDYVALTQQQAKEKQAYQQTLQQHDPSLPPAPFYLGAKQRIAEMSLSSSGRYLIVALEDTQQTWRNKHDIMPDYLAASGHVAAKPVRARVSETEPHSQQLMILDLLKGSKTPITWEGLSGYHDDVLAAVKQENAQAMQQDYVKPAHPAVRDIALMSDWSWTQSAMQWHPSQDQLLIMLEAQDNKDRWLASVDLAKGKLTTEHRLHDPAWINYTHNQFGWLPQTPDQFYFLSEENGYSNLYLDQLGQAHQPLVAGKFVINQVRLSPDQQYLYYRANVQHPGQYNVHRVRLSDGQSEQLTQWQGDLSYQLSPQGDALLLQASTLTQPNELYLQVIGGQRQQLTHYTSQTFRDYPWQAPQIIAVPSSHGAAPIYARLYLPQGFDPQASAQYPAVVFNHGAGYLQNSHYGFSSYFREYMFHNLLTQQGYVVLDMDYRGSKGYGREWRTAIYRQMGHPEIEDLQDGVDWLVKHAQVDRQRIGTYGGSYGGFLTFMALFRSPELFQSGAALRPVTDWAHYNAPYTSNILNTPQLDPLAFRRSSPIEYAEGLQKPLLIMAGVLDDNVFFQDSVRLVQRLIELEKPMFETAIYPVEPHGFKQPSSWLDEYRRIYQLFERTLKK